MSKDNQTIEPVSDGLARLEGLSKSNPANVSGRIEELCSYVSNSGEDARVAAEILRDIADETPETIAPHFGKLLKLARQTNSEDVRQPLIEACEYMRDQVTETQLHVNADDIFAVFDIGTDNDKILLSGVIRDLAQIDPERVTQRIDIINQLLHANISLASVYAINAIESIIRHSPNTVTKFEDKLFEIVEQSNAAEEVNSALSMLCTIVHSGEAQIDEKRLVINLRNIALGEGNYGGAVMQDATHEVGKLIIHQPSFYKDLLDVIVRNLNASDAGVRHQAGWECLRIGNNEPNVFRQSENISSEYISQRIEELNDEFQYDEQFDQYQSTIANFNKGDNQ